MFGRPSLSVGFGLHLKEAKGIVNSSLSGVPLQQSVVQADLPERIVVHGLIDGHLGFDFKSNPAYCGGALPDGIEFVTREYQEAAKKRNDLALKRTRFMNAFIATLWAGAQDAGHGLLPQPSVHIGNYLFADEVAGQWTLSGPETPNGNRLIPAESIAKAADYMKEICSCYEANAIELLALMQAATVHYNNHEFSSCLILGWSVVEALQNNLWADYIEKAKTRNGGFTEINRNRHEQLNGRDFSASVVSQILSLAGLLDDNTLDQMNTARKARNNFVHFLKPVDAEVALLPVYLASAIIAKRTGCSFRMGGSFSWRS